MQVIYLQDCGSTHGTYIDKKRLEAGVEYALTEGEIITFGQRVTSGAGEPSSPPTKSSKGSVGLLSIYSHIPRQEIHCSFEMGSSGVGQSSLSTPILWLTFYSEVQDSYFLPTGSIGHPAFTSDFDHSSESSREGSVQIVESHGHIFSVPSSDDEVDLEDEEDEVQIASSVKSGREEGSAATTPDGQAFGKVDNTVREAHRSETGTASCESRGLNLKGPTLQTLLGKTAQDGTSLENPINLEGVCPTVIDVDNETEDDDGPDVLPFYAASRADQLNQEKNVNESQVARQTCCVTLPTMMTAAEKQSDQDLETGIHHIVPETRAKVAKGGEARGCDPTRIRTESIAEATDDFSSEDDDSFDYDDGFFDEDFEPFREPSVLDNGVSRSSKPKVAFQIDSEKPRYTTLTPPFDEFRPTRVGHVSVSDPIDVSEPSEPSSRRAQRAPSPSDAALAKKANDPKTSLGRDNFDLLLEPKWPPAAKTTYPQSTENASDKTPSREEYIAPYAWPELQSPEPRSYDQGPFSNQPKVIVPVARSPKPDSVKNQYKWTTVSWADPNEENDINSWYIDRSARTAKQASKNTPHEEIDNDLMNIDRSAWAAKQASRFTIPSLVENYHAEDPGSLKRRHENMNGSNNVGSMPDVTSSASPMIRTSGYKRSFAECLREEESPIMRQSLVDQTDSMWGSGEDKSTHHQVGLVDRDSLLNDAQPRENIFQTSTASLSQDSVPEPDLGQVPITTTVQADDTEGPAPKKAKTSSSSSGGIGKFAMGVGFGLLGAAAAFVATIPTSVYEEALREFNIAA